MSRHSADTPLQTTTPGRRDTASNSELIPSASKRPKISASTTCTGKEGQRGRPHSSDIFAQWQTPLPVAGLLRTYPTCLRPRHRPRHHSWQTQTSLKQQACFTLLLHVGTKAGPARRILFLLCPMPPPNCCWPRHFDQPHTQKRRRSSLCQRQMCRAKPSTSAQALCLRGSHT